MDRISKRSVRARFGTAQNWVEIMALRHSLDPTTHFVMLFPPEHIFSGYKLIIEHCLSVVYQTI